MTSSRYKRPSQRRELDDHGSRIPSVEFGNPRPTFRAAITDHFDDVTTERRAYFGGVDTDTVFWDYWDDNYNRQFFDPFFQPSGPDAGRIGAVDLLIPGLYGIRATIDWATATLDAPTVPFNSWVGSNYDDGGVSHIYMDPNSDIIMEWVMDQFRIVWPSYTGAEGSVEITAAHDDVTDEPLYIPGGFAGYWAMPPYLTIVYLGGLEGDPEFFQDV